MRSKKKNNKNNKYEVDAKMVLDHLLYKGKGKSQLEEFIEQHGLENVYMTALTAYELYNHKLAKSRRNLRYLKMILENVEVVDFTVDDFLPS